MPVGGQLRRQWCGFLLLICGTFVLLFVVVHQYSPAPPVLVRDDEASLRMGPLPEEETLDGVVAPETYPRGTASDELAQRRSGRGVRCDTLKSLGECARHAHCTPIQGDACAAPGTVDKSSLFGHCVSSLFASTYSTKKMKLRREVPEWMSCHPDHSAICARPSGSGGPVARFTQKIIPPGWQKCVDCCVPPEPVPGSADQSLAIIVTVQDELASLVNALKSWQRHGLLDYAQERYLNIDGGDSDSRNRITGLARSYGFTVFTSETSQGISSAMARLMQAVKSPFVLLLEKDWKLVESRATVLKQLDLAKRLMFSRQNGSRADLVKFRSRWNFGFPNVSPRKTVPPDWDIGVSMQPDQAPAATSHTCPLYDDATSAGRWP
ncbi:uncharacterized protein ACA1_091470 [Acanthamoeba castellanii str. Neff]|uniref:Uncharacterized protein n=1 Tax=Acanthamoeba castellanii (strain ATCC 30010 / Neff) TaxID=1257118 RepID=L8GI56_ACACF|nr:uncharacterized protein ACA1_091470 [Acanthamoeba castellanii str. Neff]ELR12637.1 hypothetical protein ACA1_091470 [Acanthamoeba castellanii str. Neff]